MHEISINSGFHELRLKLYIVDTNQSYNDPGHKLLYEFIIF